MPTPRRSDSRRNRAAILRVATEALSCGPAVISLPRIARLAGVGQATVYRHFPDRRALAAAVLAEQLSALRGQIAGRRQEPAAFRPLLRCVLVSQASMRPLVTLVRQQPQRDQQRYADQLVGILSRPFRAAQAAGLLRPDLEPADLVTVFAMLEAVVEDPIGRPADAARTRRTIEVVLDGLFQPVGAGATAGRGQGLSGRVDGRSAISDTMSATMPYPPQSTSRTNSA